MMLSFQTKQLQKNLSSSILSDLVYKNEYCTYFFISNKMFIIVEWISSILYVIWGRNVLIHLHHFKNPAHFLLQIYLVPTKKKLA